MALQTGVAERGRARPVDIAIDRGVGGRDELASAGSSLAAQHGIVDEFFADRVRLPGKDEVSLKIGALEADEVGVDPASPGVADHAVAEHIGEGRNRGLVVYRIAHDS